MNSFHLKIVTPDGLIFDADAEKLIVRTNRGDVAILAGHINYVAPLGMGRAIVVSEGQRRTAACIGGILSVLDGEVTLVPTTFEWADEIDLDRVLRSHQRADQILSNSRASETDIALAQARLHRAVVRKSVVTTK